MKVLVIKLIITSRQSHNSHTLFQIALCLLFACVAANPFFFGSGRGRGGGHRGHGGGRSYGGHGGYGSGRSYGGHRGHGGRYGRSVAVEEELEKTVAIEEEPEETELVKRSAEPDPEPHRWLV